MPPERLLNYALCTFYEIFYQGEKNFLVSEISRKKFSKELKFSEFFSKPRLRQLVAKLLIFFWRGAFNYWKIVNLQNMLVDS